MPALTSTRGGDAATFEEAILRGLARDGGLFMPTPLPTLDWASRPPNPTVAEASAWAARALLDGHMDARTVAEVVAAAFDFPLPLVEVERDLYVLELFHGPSLAFKDYGARAMAGFMRAGRDQGTSTILVATSGDTGSAVAAAFRQMATASIVLLFPHTGVSERQRRQMTTLGPRVRAVAVRGTFDDCQRLAKEAFADEDLCERHRLTSANSINIGRLLPQALYYVYAACRLERAPYFVVPCGNLGNLCAGVMAHLAGMPAEGFLAATNVNDAFGVFLASRQTGEKEVIQTLSNAMDVALPSNLERIRWLFQDDRDAIGDLITTQSVTDEETLACIADVHRRNGYVLDPHTAVAYRALERTGAPRDAPAVVLATAHPAKFPSVVEEAIGEAVPLPPALQAALERREHVVEMEPKIDELRALLSDAAAHV